jgi:DNA helicase-2/ATP-dependent DNA helicase PcrA
MESLIEGLNPQQREAVIHTEGPLLIVAGAGSGKTRVIVHRLAWILSRRLAAPHEVVAVTFTNKAAGEMKERVDALVGPDHGGALVSTFHSFCLRLLRRHAPRLGFGADFLVYDDTDQQTLLKDCLEALSIDEETWPVRQLRNRISDAKNRGLDPEALLSGALGPADEITARVFAAYQKALRSANAMDFDDLIGQVLALFAAHADVRDSVASRVRYLLVDEYQDTNPPQYRLIRHLASVHGNVCAVGDPDQSIYRFRFADINNILSFESDFPGTRLIKLEQNYRSTNNILAAATAMVRHNQSRIDKALWSEAEAGEPLDLLVAPDDRAEADAVVQRIRALRREGLPLEGAAVLYRTNFQSRLFEEALARAGIPYVMIGGTRFYDRREVRDVLAYVRLLLNPRDEASVRRILNVPPRDIGKTTLEALQTAARRDDLPLLEAIEAAAGGNGQGLNAPGGVGGPMGAVRTVTPRAARALAGFLDLLRELREAARELPPSRLVARVVSRTGYDGWLHQAHPEDALARLENLEELASAVASYDGMEGGLQAFLDRTALLSETDNTQGSAGVRLMTLHSAKGLEFPAVFIVGLEESLCPHVRASDNEMDLEEERRLLYVGMTRARRRLFLSRALTRYQFGAAKSAEPSRFLREIPANLLREEIASDPAWGPRPARSPARFPRRPAAGDPARALRHWSEAHDEPEPPTPPSAFSLGCKVHHAEYGVGTVIGIEGTGDAQKVTVSFSIVGAKKFLPRYARLERI